MTSPESTPYRPRLVGGPEDYPYDDGSPMAVWRDQGRAHETRRRLIEMHRQVEEMRQDQHDAYVAECERLADRYRAENALAAARWPQGNPATTGYAPDPVRAPWPPSPKPRGIRWPEDETPSPAPDTEPEVSGDIRDRATALFRTVPSASRATVKAVLGCTEYEAKKLCAAKDEILGKVNG